MEPADVYMTLELAEIANTSVDDIVSVYKANRGKGWGVIAKELGIKPGSDEFML
jgi:cobalamin biosynthesis protein CbiG